MSFILTRTQLHELVWSEPMHCLERQTAISKTVIAEHCKELDVPLPTSGYWSKVRAGKDVVRTPLPQNHLATVQCALISGMPAGALKKRLGDQIAIAETEKESTAVLTDCLRERLGDISVPQDFVGAHLSIIRLLHLDRKRLKRYGGQSHFEKPFAKRRLLFLNALCLAFEKIGGKVSIQSTCAHGLTVRVAGSSVEFELVEHRLWNGDWRTASKSQRGLLRLRVSERCVPAKDLKCWEDEGVLRIESQITDIVIGLTVLAEKWHREWLEKKAVEQHERREQEKKNKIRRAKDQIRRDREYAIAMERARIDRLFQNATAWQKATGVRTYIQAVLDAFRDQREPHSLEDWSRWALAQVNEIDPIASGRALPA